ncbi:MAG: ATP-binding protein [Bacteroidales bacterium]|nr:ATP-binding protein [Bacteroidales bacterium]
MATSDNLQSLPIGIQDFPVLRENNYLYVDKTHLLYDLTKERYTYFLARPRRFGKSLILSTLQAYFEGRKELFEGLAIEKLEQKWEKYPVIRLDLSLCESKNALQLERTLKLCLQEEYMRHQLEKPDPEASAPQMFGELITTLYYKTGKQVVILVDEYDKGLIAVLRDRDQLDESSEVLRDFYINIKARGAMIRFAMLTGVARFHHVTIFSGLNNLLDISLNSKYAAICGFTPEELEKYFYPYIQQLGGFKGWDVPKTISRLLQEYDGYRFSKADTQVTNPFSILRCMYDQDMRDYWFSTGTSKILVDFLRANNYTLADLDGAKVDINDLGDIYQEDNPIPLFYQTGYLTIKEVDGNWVTLGFPNGEVQRALVTKLMPQFMGIDSRGLSIELQKLQKAVNEGHVDQLMDVMQSIIASIPYHLWPDKTVEATFHMLVHVICMMAGIYTQSEMCQSRGRVDMVLATYKKVFVFEFKLDGNPQEALDQIDSQGYTLRWKADDREVVKIGVVFSSTERNITAWATR